MLPPQRISKFIHLLASPSHKNRNIKIDLLRISAADIVGTEDGWINSHTLHITNSIIIYIYPVDLLPAWHYAAQNVPGIYAKRLLTL